MKVEVFVPMSLVMCSDAICIHWVTSAVSVMFTEICLILSNKVNIHFVLFKEAETQLKRKKGTLPILDISSIPNPPHYQF